MVSTVSHYMLRYSSTIPLKSMHSSPLRFPRWHIVISVDSPGVFSSFRNHSFDVQRGKSSNSVGIEPISFS